MDLKLPQDLDRSSSSASYSSPLQDAAGAAEGPAYGAQDPFWSRLGSLEIARKRVEDAAVGRLLDNAIRGANAAHR